MKQWDSIAYEISESLDHIDMFEMWILLSPLLPYLIPQFCLWHNIENLMKCWKQLACFDSSVPITVYFYRIKQYTMVMAAKSR